MLKLMLSLLLLMFTSSAWSQDQARGGGTASFPTANFCPRGQDYLQNELLRVRTEDLKNTNPNDLNREAPNRPIKPNNYLNILLLKLKPNVKTFIDPGCIQSAFNEVNEGFFACNGHTPYYDTPKPCLSREYKALIHYSFEFVTSCLREFVAESKNTEIQNRWIENYFKMLSLESGFHPNVISADRKDVGIGQLRAEYIKDFKDNTLAPLREFLSRNEASKSCKMLGSEILTNTKINNLLNRNNSINICAQSNVKEGQPLLDIMIGFSHLRHYKNLINRELKNYPKYNNFRATLSSQERIDLEIKLTSWSYNLGANGLIFYVKQTLDNSASTYSQAADKVMSFIRSSQIPANKNYVLSMEKRYKQVLNGRTSCRK